MLPLSLLTKDKNKTRVSCIETARFLLLKSPFVCLDHLRIQTIFREPRIPSAPRLLKSAGNTGCTLVWYRQWRSIYYYYQFNPFN